MGGGDVRPGLPAVVFVAVYLPNGRVLQPALIAALGAGVVILVWLIRRQPLTQVLAGFAGVAISAYVSSRTGEARDFFPVGSDRERRLRIGVPDLAGCSVALMGVVVGAITGDPTGWRRDPELRRIFAAATWVGAGVRWPDPGAGSAVPRRLGRCPGYRQDHHGLAAVPVRRLRDLPAAAAGIRAAALSRSAG